MIKPIHYSLIFLAVAFLLGCSSTEEPGPVENAHSAFTFEPPFYFGRNYEIPEDNPVTEESFVLGRELFYETQLSRNGEISCASCHQQSKAFTDGLTVSVGERGQTGQMNAMSLSNLLWVKQFFWDGRSPSLEAQALHPIEDPVEMDLPLDMAVARLQAIPKYPTMFEQAFGSPEINPERIGKALATFERALISDSSRYDGYLRGELELSEQELLGMELFFAHPEPSIGLRGANCGDCHVGPLVTGEPTGFEGFHNNGLDTDANLKEGLAGHSQRPGDQGKFRAPSLRNIALTAPYMHDGRFSTLAEVLDHYDEHIQMSQTLDPLIIEASNEVLFPGDAIKLYLTQEEKAAILVFLHTLTDEAFINNPKFANPNQSGN